MFSHWYWFCNLIRWTFIRNLHIKRPSLILCTGFVGSTRTIRRKISLHSEALQAWVQRRHRQNSDLLQYWFRKKERFVLDCVTQTFARSARDDTAGACVPFKTLLHYLYHLSLTQFLSLPHLKSITKSVRTSFAVWSFDLLVCWQNPRFTSQNSLNFCCHKPFALREISALDTKLKLLRVAF